MCSISRNMEAGNTRTTYISDKSHLPCLLVYEIQLINLKMIVVGGQTININLTSVPNNQQTWASMPHNGQDINYKN